MTSTKVPLSLAEKKKLRSTFNIRLVVGFVFILPIMVTSTYLCLQAVIENSLDVASLFPIGLFILCVYLFFKLAVPFYKKTFKNIRATHKIVIETRIIDIKTDFSGDYGLSYVIQTEAHVPIYSTLTALLDQTFSYKDMHVNMRISIHCMEDNLMDILYIEPLAD